MHARCVDHFSYHGARATIVICCVEFDHGRYDELVSVLVLRRIGGTISYGEAGWMAS